MQGLDCLSKSIVNQTDGGKPSNASQINSTIDQTGCVPNNETAMAILRIPPLLETDFLMTVLYISAMSVLIVLGTFGNIWIIIISMQKNIINKMGKFFMVNLALADLCVAVIADPMCIFGAIKGEEYFNGKPVFCHFIASLCLTACFCAFLNLTMLTVNRYVYLCHNNLYRKLYNRFSTIILCIMCWIGGFLLEFPNFIGWGGHYFDKKNHQCIWNRTASLSYSLFVSIGLIGGPFLAIGTCNILIFHEIWKRKVDLYKLNDGNQFPSLKAWQDTVRTSKMLFLVFTMFVICWTPYAVVIAIDVEDKLSVETHLFVTMLAHTHSSCNGIIYMIMNVEFRRAVRAVFSFKRSPSQESSDPGQKTIPVSSVSR